MLFLVFYLDGLARAFPIAGVMFICFASGTYALYKSLRDGIFPGARYAPVVRGTDPIKFWMSCAVTLVIVVFSCVVSILSFFVGVYQILN